MKVIVRLSANVGSKRRWDERGLTNINPYILHSKLDSVFFEISEDDSEGEMNGSHGDGVETITIHAR